MDGQTDGRMDGRTRARLTHLARTLAKEDRQTVRRRGTKNSREEVRRAAESSVGFCEVPLRNIMAEVSSLPVLQPVCQPSGAHCEPFLLSSRPACLAAQPSVSHSVGSECVTFGSLVVSHERFPSLIFQFSCTVPSHAAPSHSLSSDSGMSQQYLYEERVKGCRELDARKASGGGVHGKKRKP